MASFEFKGMLIKRLTAHTVFARGPDKETITPPDYSESLIELGQDALDLIQQRITDALGSTSHGVEMTINNSDTDSFMQVGAAMIRASDEQFYSHSKTLADNLTRAQTSPRWPGGVLVVISGTVGVSSKPFTAVIKAETDKGFNIVKIDGHTTLELIKKMLLSETQRLYKVGILIEMTTAAVGDDGKYPVDNYRAFLFDHLLSATETKNAAAYFYAAFLGFGIQSSSRHQTKVFFDESKNFINSAPIPDEDRYTLREALRAELRSNTTTVSAKEFAEKHLPEEHQPAYIKHLVAKGFPDQAVVKDLDFIKHQLKRPRNVLFSSGVKIHVPAEQDFKELVAISTAANGYTQVMIKGTVAEQD